MKIISAGIQRPAVIILALTSFLLLSASQAFAQDKSRASIQKGNDDTFSHVELAKARAHGRYIPNSASLRTREGI